MNKKKLLALLGKKEARKAELIKKSDASEDVAELRSIGGELDTLNGEIAELRSITDAMPDEPTEAGTPPVIEGAGELRSTPVGQLNVLGTYGVGQAQAPTGEQREADLTVKFESRGADLKAKKAVTFEIEEIPELRAVTIGGGTLVVEKKYSNTLNPKFSQVSSLVDVVNAVPLLGGESYTKGFEVSSGEGDYTTESGDYKEAEPVFDYVTIGKAKITAYAEMTDESMKLPNVDYQAMVAKNIGEAIRKKLTKQIIVGAGGANAVTGIFNAPANVLPTSSDLSISAIDADTLDKIVLGYGGDEEVEGGGYLILNKKDLAAFAAVRSTTGEKLYKIKKNGNTGTISSDDSFEVPFIINSACAPLSSDATVANTYCMAYGMIHCYEMPVFSPVTVEESRDFKFKTGQIAYRGAVWAGGNVTMYKGFTRVKKVAAV
ncbi:phage major capsid protein [Bacillus sp. ISL-40]|uniref:phage major capsid protein n=1 Tax=unclassified Bacillus (in: firmicutes) TaxID=185979 RepID=UPI001BED1ECC|nr:MULTISPECIES: phage major capsid protein [unclassified Bacillus (in: firmicutes)]MBT2696351.1 phage major capsid protein [Bacillus sp. ISL-40]MBT2743200.1 phage major capsid protein [Bacillus sp. ISL-77]